MVPEKHYCYFYTFQTFRHGHFEQVYIIVFCSLYENFLLAYSRGNGSVPKILYRFICLHACTNSFHQIFENFSISCIRPHKKNSWFFLKIFSVNVDPVS